MEALEDFSKGSECAYGGNARAQDSAGQAVDAAIERIESGVVSLFHCIQHGNYLPLAPPELKLSDQTR